MYYKKLVKQKKLVQLWINVKNNIKNIFEINYQMLTFLYRNNCFLDYKRLIFEIKNILPLITSLSSSGSVFFYIFSDSFYNQSIGIKYHSFINKLQNKNLGVFTNFSSINGKLANILDYKVIPCFIFIFYVMENDLLLIESKKKNIISICFINNNLSSALIDYPLFLNSLYFYSVYLFNKLFMRLILLKK